MSISSKFRRAKKLRMKAIKKGKLVGLCEKQARIGKQDALLGKPDATASSPYRPEWELSKPEQAYRQSYRNTFSTK